MLAETIYRLRRNNPGWDGVKTTSVRDLIVGTFEGGRVDDFKVDDSFPGSDVNDRHVHAAAIACQADFVLTDDEGFVVNGQDADAMPYEVYRSDDFFLLVDDSVPDLVRRVTREQTLYWARRTGRADLAGKLIAAGCPEFAERVRNHQGELSLSGVE
ncbi:PIN domain-containing protein [Umezawaea endophytica]|uniref:PIN domain-containing protein n=1 Tax=Umezawaea endophytica TaxID=1654476 RepID=A0A9X2VP87_9PSEU|nr:PIN domain-containing protein [Umezawaea endophytica]MCS7479997.1 PIN domain-containing protein [Umezawaea endophytica]